MSVKKDAVLVLADGKTFSGRMFGKSGKASGEVVFNTSLSGYQEILTDPSYAGQLLTFTYPHIGNVGCNEEDVESSKVHCRGLIVKKQSRRVSNFRAQSSLHEFLVDNNTVAIEGLDTRELVLHLRDEGSQMGIIASLDEDLDSLKEEAKNLEPMTGKDLVKEVTCSEPYTWNQKTWELGTGYAMLPDDQASKHIVCIDFGIKYNILRLLCDRGFKLTVVPASSSAEEILSLNPDGVFLSNGPGDPAAVTYGIETVKNLLGKTPIFGICLGHQILGHALGAPTFKLPFGHRGGNHPVKNKATGSVEITVQNHGFATDLDKVPGNLDVSHMNLNDNTVEGFDFPELRAFSTQYHPESSPGPHDSHYLFDRFAQLVNA